MPGSLRRAFSKTSVPSLRDRDSAGTPQRVSSSSQRASSSSFRRSSSSPVSSIVEEEPASTAKSATKSSGKSPRTSTAKPPATSDESPEELRIVRMRVRAAARQKAMEAQARLQEEAFEDDFWASDEESSAIAALLRPNASEIPTPSEVPTPRHRRKAEKKKKLDSLNTSGVNSPTDAEAGSPRCPTSTIGGGEVGDAELPPMPHETVVELRKQLSEMDKRFASETHLLGEGRGVMYATEEEMEGLKKAAELVARLRRAEAWEAAACAENEGGGKGKGKKL